MANKFKVGDKIRAIDNAYGVTNKVNEFEGIVVAVYGDYIDINCTKHKYEASKHIWYRLHYSHFELIHTPEIHITVKGNETIAVYRNGDEYKKAVAKCSPDDTFDFGIGTKLALERLGVLPTELKEEPKYYNGKVVCVKTSTNHWTVGKIYEIKDGKLKCDYGWEHPRSGEPYKDVLDIRHIGGVPLVDARHNPNNEFIPLIEDEPNEPLTTEELEKMDGQRVWVLSLGENNEAYCQKQFGGWGTIHNACVIGDNFSYGFYNNYRPLGFRAYRKPLEGYEE